MPNISNRLVRLFVYSAAVLLLSTSLAKILSAFGDARILDGPDPIFGIDIRIVLLTAAAIEGVAAWFCIRKTPLRLQLQILAWISTVFLLYRVGLWTVGYDGICGCLGTFTEALHISPAAADLGMKIALSYLLIGSYAAYFCAAPKRKPQSLKVIEYGQL
jgi:hypothetical protein